MMPETITAVSAGTKQGFYRPQVRVYYHNDKYGILFVTLTKPLRCRSRARAIARAKEWMKTDQFANLLDDEKAKISAQTENTI